MKRVFHCIPILLALVLVQVVLAIAGDEPVLKKIQFEARAPGEERVIFQLTAARVPRVFAIKGENPRVVFDFPDTSIAGSLANVIDTKGAFIRRIRIGLHRQPSLKTRVVLDLVPGANLDFRQQFDQERNALTVTLFRPGTSHGATTQETASFTPPVEKKPGQDTKKESIAQPSPSPAPTVQPAPTARQEGPGVQEHETAASPAVSNTPGQKDTQQESGSAATNEADQEMAMAPPAAGGSTGEKSAATPPEQPEQPKESEEPEKPEKIAADRLRPFTPFIEYGKEEPKPDKEDTTAEETTAPAMPTKEPVLRSITFDKSSNRGEMVLFKFSDFHPPAIFGIEKGQPRVVCDFKGAKAEAGVKKKIDVNGRYVKSIRVGKHRNPDRLRVVLDLEPNNYDLQQVFFKDDNLFVLIINTINNAPTPKEAAQPVTKSPKP